MELKTENNQKFESCEMAVPNSVCQSKHDSSLSKEVYIQNTSMSRCITNNNLLTFSQVAERMGISTKTVGRMVHSGQLIAIRFSRKTVRISEEDLAKTIKIHREK